MHPIGECRTGSILMRFDLEWGRHRERDHAV